MKKYSLKYHLLNENPTLDSPNAGSELIPFNIPVDNFGSINAKLNRESFKELLYLLKLEDENLLKNILSKYIKFEKTNINADLSKEINALTDNVNKSQTLIDSINNSLSLYIDPSYFELEPDIRITTNDSDNFDSYNSDSYDFDSDDFYDPSKVSFKPLYNSYDRSIKNVFSEYLFENFASSDENKISNKLLNISSKEEADEIIKKLKSLQSCVDEIKSNITGSSDKKITTALDAYDRLSFADIIDKMPAEADLQQTITSAVDAKDVKDFKEKLKVCFYQNCGLHKPKKVLEKITKLSEVAERIKAIQAENDPNEQALSSLFEEMNLIVRRITSIRSLVEKYKEKTGVNLKTIGKDADLRDFFTAQGTKIGYLLEDIIGVIYNSSNGDLNVNDSRLNIGAAATRTKPYALALCAVLLNKLKIVAQGGVRGSHKSLITSEGYSQSLKYFIENCLEGKGAENAKVQQFKINMNKIMRPSDEEQLENSYMYNIDKVLGNISEDAGVVAAKNSAFDFLICNQENPEAGTANPSEGTSIAVFDLKSSHKDSITQSTARVPTGSNLNNNATNELIRLSDVDDNLIVDDKENISSKIDEVLDSEKKRFKIHSVSLVKVKWNITENFEIEDINASMASLYGSTLESAVSGGLSFFADDRREVESKKSHSGKSPLRNISLSSNKNIEHQIELFKKYLNSDSNKIVKVPKVNENNFNIFYDQYTNNEINIENDIIVMQDKSRTKEEFDNYKAAINFYMSTAKDDLDGYKDKSNESTIDSFKDLFEDDNKLKTIETNLRNILNWLGDNIEDRHEFLIKNMASDTKEKSDVARYRKLETDRQTLTDDLKKLSRPYTNFRYKYKQEINTNSLSPEKTEKLKKLEVPYLEKKQELDDFVEENKTIKSKIKEKTVLLNEKLQSMLIIMFLPGPRFAKFKDPSKKEILGNVKSNKKNKSVITNFLNLLPPSPPAQTPAQTPAKKKSLGKTTDSYNRKGKLLREVYSHLFRK